MGHTRTAIVTVVCLLVVLGTVTPVVANDQFESNDSLETATTLGPGTYTGLTLDGDESDYFAIDLERGETLNVTAAFPKQADGEEADNRPDVELLTADGTLVDRDAERTSPASPTVDHVLQYQSDADQTVFLRIYGRTNRDTATDYTLSVARGANDRFEQNGVPGTATSLDPGTYEGLTLLDDESDYFAIDLERGETLNASVAFPKQADGAVADNDPEVRLYDATGDRLDIAEERTSPTSSVVRYVLQYQSTVDQTVYLRVYGEDDREVWTSYDLTYERGANDRYEPNGVVDSASTLEPGSYENLTLLDDESDYYGIDLGRGETLNVSVTFPKQADGEIADTRPEVRLYDATGDRLDIAEERTSPTSSVVRYVLQYQSDADQTTYLRVYGQTERDVTTDYALSVERGMNDQFEPNGVIDRAAPVGAGEYNGLTLLDAEEDWYAVTLEDDETLNVTVRFPKQADGEIADNRPEVRLYDATGDFLETADEETSAVAESVTFTLQYDPAGDQTVYLRVYGQSDREVFTSYDMSITGPGTEGPPPVIGDPPQDPDGDGTYEDVNGDGVVNVVDVQALFANLDDTVVRNNPDAFDFNGDGRVDVVDVQRLFNEL